MHVMSRAYEHRPARARCLEHVTYARCSTQPWGPQIIVWNWLKGMGLDGVAVGNDGAQGPSAVEMDT